MATVRTDGTVFEEAVIYLDRHSLAGAHGLIINKPVTEANAPPDGLPQDIPDYALLYGGPVGLPDMQYVLLPAPQDATIPLAAVEVGNLKGSGAFQEQVHDRFTADNQKRIYYGYAGWAPWQLNHEMMKGTWAVIDYDPALMFETPLEDIWPLAIRRVQEKSPPVPGGA